MGMNILIHRWDKDQLFEGNLISFIVFIGRMEANMDDNQPIHKRISIVFLIMINFDNKERKKNIKKILHLYFHCMFFYSHCKRFWDEDRPAKSYRRASNACGIFLVKIADIFDKKPYMFESATGTLLFGMIRRIYRQVCQDILKFHKIFMIPAVLSQY